MPDDHSKVVPLLPIPNRTVKRLRADDSAHSCVKVGHRQALTAQTAPVLIRVQGRFALGAKEFPGPTPLCVPKFYTVQRAYPCD